MTLKHNQFEVLRALRERGGLTQRELANATGMALGTVNTAVRECQALGFVAGRGLTEAGTAALEPYRVANAVIMAAGMSSRFVPISYERPKGLLSVHGEVLIERQIRQLRAAGITDITVVVGYKKEYFAYLVQEFGVRLVANPEYAYRNNHSTLWVVRQDLANTYVCSSDNYFTENPFEPYVYQAYYATQRVTGETDEWCLEVGAGGRIAGIAVGGSDALVMSGHAYFDRTFSETFRIILEQTYGRPETAGKFWEDLYAENLTALEMVVREYPPGSIREFDSLEQLAEFDPDFIENVDSQAFDNIVAALGAPRSEIGDFYPLKQGLTNLSCHFSAGNREYVYRHPGAGAGLSIDRPAEFEALNLARTLDLDPTFVAGDPERGWKVSRFIPAARGLDTGSEDELRDVMAMARTLHCSGATLTREFDFVSHGLSEEARLARFGPIDIPGYAQMRRKVLRLKGLTDADGFRKVPSHNDLSPLNVLVGPQGKLHLIDWEHAGMADEGNDFGTFVVHGELTDAQAARALEHYFGRAPTDREYRNYWSHVVLAAWCWFVWALAREAEGDNTGDWLLTYHQRIVENLDRCLAMYSEDAGAPHARVRMEASQ